LQTIKREKKKENKRKRKKTQKKILEKAKQEEGYLPVFAGSPRMRKRGFFSSFRREKRISGGITRDDAQKSWQTIDTLADSKEP
jgi:hypothetical protein